jgi:uncharacterized protein (DUF433 family)
MHDTISTPNRLKILAEAKAGATSEALATRYPYPQAQIRQLMAAGASARTRKLSAADEDAMLAASESTTQAAMAAQYGVHRNSVLRALERAAARAVGTTPTRQGPQLSPERAAEAERLRVAGEPVADLAKRYGLSVAAITRAMASQRRDAALHAAIDGRPIKPQTETGHTGLTGDLAAKVLAKREAMRLENPAQMNVILDLAQVFNLPAGVIKQTLIDERKRQVAPPDFSHLA